MAFDKTKALASAQQYVTQGKIPQAIAEYLVIVKKDPKDLNLLNTLGDLYVRINQHEDALKQFYKLGDAYVADGFLMRGIAIYKKIVKLDANSVQAMEKLAELYVLQGLLSEARSQYLQLAEYHLKGNRTDAAVGVFQKMLELEPDNVTVQNRLADLYQRLGKKSEAVSIYIGAAERLIYKDDYLEATKLVDKALGIEKKNVAAQVLKARCEMQLGQATEAVSRLQAVPNYEEEGGVVEVLLEAFIAIDRFSDARTLAEHIISKHPERYAGVFTVAEHEVQLGENEAALQLLQEIAAAMVAQREVERLATLVRQIASALPANPVPLELLVDINRRAGDMSFLSRSLARLAECYVQVGDFEKARTAYEEVVQLDPGTPEYAQKLREVLQKLGVEAVAAPPAAQAVEMEPITFGREEPAPAPAAAESGLDEATRTYVAGALTDADLYANYGSTQKAIDLLEQVVGRVPSHPGAREKLLDLYVGVGQADKIVATATGLAELYRTSGDRANAEKFAEIAARYRRAAPAAAAPAATHEVDLSAEWETAATAPPSVEVNWKDVREEVGFYIDQNMFQEAHQVLARLEGAHGENPAFIELRDRVGSAEVAATMPASVGGETTTVIEFGGEAAAAAAPTEFEIAPAGGTQEITFETAAEEPAVAEPAVTEPEGETYEVTLEPVATAPAPAAAGTGLLDELAGELDDALGSLGTAAGAAPSPTPPPAAKATPPPPPTRGTAPAPAARTDTGGLTGLLDEFREELGEVEGVEGEDPETHYSLGIAYREMGLYDEAISEFQKVVKASEHRPYASILQCFTLLALCFMEKGMPKIAVRWYDRALRTPGLDEEGSLALRYDMGLAFEAAGERDKALDCFTEVYSSNIDYRDVAERIRALQKELR